MHILGIETSGFGGSVALRSEERTLAARELTQAGRRHAQTLVQEIAELFRSAGLRPHDCDLVALSIGPGSFTGLRVGAVCANTFAYAADCRLVAVDTYLAIAEAAPAEFQQLHVIGNAQRQELFFAEYHRNPDGMWTRHGKIEIANAETWLGKQPPSSGLTGPGVDDFSQWLPPDCRTVPDTLRNPHAETVARIGERLAPDALPGGSSLEPFYLRKSAAEEKWDANQAKNSNS